MQTLPFILAVFLLGAQQEEQLRQIERKLEDLQQQTQRQLQVIGTLSQRADQISKEVAEIRPALPNCAASLELIGDPSRTALSEVNTAVELEFFSAVGNAKGCFPAEVRLSATYVNAKGEAICNGVVEGVLFQTTVTQSFVLEIRPWDFQNYVRWKNGHTQPTLRLFSPIRCLNDIPADAQQSELDRIAGVRARVLLLPGSGTMAMKEFRILPEVPDPAPGSSRLSPR